MKNFLNFNFSDISEEKKKLLNKYTQYQSKNLNLNMSRGKPGSDQLNLSSKILDVVSSNTTLISDNGVDYRNYGINDGLPEMKEFISKATGIDKNNFIVGGNSSLSMMFDVISYFMIHGVNGLTPWLKQEKIKFLCPSPGYDRHFAISEYFGMELITIPMTKEGPDMDIVEKYVSTDETIKGMWCVPKYSNPQGIVYSDTTVKRIANLKPKAQDFRVMWDNAYFVHDLTDNPKNLLDIFQECQKSKNDQLLIAFFSTSKITFPGAGVAFMACTGKNLENFKKMYSIKTVGFDKINQIRHIKFLKNKTTLQIHMKKHQKILVPKFNIILEKLKNEFENNPIISWEKPQGGYFISVNTYPGCAKRTVELCKNAGVILTNAGATFPYGKDPKDSNIRLAPTFPSEKELQIATDLFCICVKIAFLELKEKQILKGCPY